MFDWEDKLKKLNDYNIAFEIKQGYYHISLAYNPNWNVLIPDNKNIYIEERNGIHHYIALVENVNIGEIFKCVEETINYNKDLERKLILFKEKAKELQDIFSKEEYDKLKTLEFTFPIQKKTIKKTKKKEKKIEDKKEKIEPVKDNVSVSTTGILTETSITTSNNVINDGGIVVKMNDGEYMEELERK